MTREETLAIMGVIHAAYPSFYRNRSEADAAVNLWAGMFADDDAELTAAAVKAFIATDEKGFPPVIGVIKSKMRELSNPEELTEYEAWGIVKKALGNSGYGYTEEYEKLPPVIRRLVGSAYQLHQWAMMDSGEVDSVVASNFMRSYRVRAAKEREYEALPEEVKRFVSELGVRSIPEAKALTEPETEARRGEIRAMLTERLTQTNRQEAK